MHVVVVAFVPLVLDVDVRIAVAAPTFSYGDGARYSVAYRPIRNAAMTVPNHAVAVVVDVGSLS